MPTQFVPVLSGWNGSSSYTGGASKTDVLVQNISLNAVRFALTDDSSSPLIGVQEAYVLLPNRHMPMQLKPNERIWFAAPSGGQVVVSF